MAQKCKLRVLKLSFCYGVKSQAIGKILHCECVRNNLEELEVFGATFDACTSAHLESFNNLCKLSLCGVVNLNNDMITKVRTYSVFNIFALFATQIFMAIGDKLIKIDLSNCNQLTNDICGPLVKYCTNLEDLCMKAIPDLSSVKLADLFTDKKRASAFKCIVFSACKNVGNVFNCIELCN